MGHSFHIILVTCIFSLEELEFRWINVVIQVVAPELLRFQNQLSEFLEKAIPSGFLIRPAHFYNSLEDILFC